MNKLYLLLTLLTVSPLYTHSQCYENLISRNRPVTVSSTRAGSPSNIVDASEESFWISEREDPQWVAIDLGIAYKLCAVTIFWDSQFYPSDYEFQLSDDGEAWETVATFPDNDTPALLLEEPGWQSRYLRVYCHERADPNEGYILKDLAIYGTIEAPVQVLTFPPIADHLSTAEAFELQASTTSGLPVEFTVLQGPATVEGNLLTLTGEGGTVTIRASQEGNEEFDPADPIERSFEVVDPAEVYPEAIITSPGAAYSVAMPGSLGQVVLGARGRIQRPEWFSVESVEMEVDGQPVEAKAGRDGHYYLYWTPESYGMHNFSVTVTGSNGNKSTNSLDFEITEEAQDVSTRSFDEEEIIAFVNFSHQEHYQLPTHLGAYDKITATLHITCPDIGCDAWDRLAHIDVRTPEGEWVEIIRYITPYGVECSHTTDLTPYASLLQGNPEMRARITTYQRGWEVSLDLEFEAGPAPYRYSKVEKLWYGYHPFGDIRNRQPADTFQVAIPAGIQDARLHLVGTGHGWGENNSGNAAEFYRATHHVLIDGQPTFEHLNWMECDPNPDGCQPQNGTWRFDRAGWCPGAISPFFEYDMSPYIGQGEHELFYRLSQGYIDQCHPNNPTCQDGFTCPNCDDGFNPHLVMAANLITYSNQPIDGSVLTDVRHIDKQPQIAQGFNLYPNPTTSRFTVEQTTPYHNVRLRLYDGTGQLLRDSGERRGWPGQVLAFDLSEQPAGIYHVVITTEEGTAVKRVVRR